MSPRVGLDAQTILTAAAEMADSAGTIDAVTLSGLAQRLSIRPPSLYNHIGGLEELRVQVAVYAGQRLYERLAVATADDDGERAVLRMSAAYLAFARSHPGLYDATQQSVLKASPEAAEQSERIVALCIRVLRPFGLHDEQAIHAIRGLRSMLHGFAVLESKEGFGMPVDLNESLEFVVRSYIRGIRFFAKGEE